MRIPKAIKKLTEAFERLPGIGPKSAQRLTFYLLHVPQEELDMLAIAVKDLKLGTVLCSVCKNVGEADPCDICTDHGRDTQTIAVVESPLDVIALEKTGYMGLYHILHGVISPLNNIGPDDIYISDLVKRLKKGTNGGNPADALSYLQGDVLSSGTSGVSEIILATNTGMEGESTAMYIAKLVHDLGEASQQVKITRIARGLPVGGDIEYADDVTLKRALEGRMIF